MRLWLARKFFLWSLLLMRDSQKRRLLLWHLDQFPDLVATYELKYGAKP